MGIAGLTKLVNTTKGALQDLSLCAERLVIDASNLLYLLYFNEGLDQNHGGEYGAFKDLVAQFIGALRECKICPYVVFDGCADFSDQKWVTEVQRAKQRVDKAHSAALTGEAKGVLPTLIWEVFRQTLTELKVPMARCYTEADRQAAALAQEWGCSVLSNDSDFFIFPLMVGVLPIAHFRWREVEQQRDGRGLLPCKRYHSSSFCKAAGISPQLLPAFAVLAGNDYTRNTERAADTRLGQKKTLPPHVQLQNLLKWMSGFSFVDSTQVFEEHVKDQTERGQQIKSLQEAADHYGLPPSSLWNYFEQDILPSLPLQMEKVVPDWMRRPVTEAWFSSDFLDVLTNRRVGLSVVVDHKDKPSANQVSLPLRRVLYGLLLGDGAVEERDRDGLEVKTATVQTVSTNISLQSLPKTAKGQRRHILLEALGLTEESLSSLPPHLDHLALPLAATCFWLKQAQPQPHPDLLTALLIGWSKGITIERKADSGQRLDLDWCHWLNQWQSCLRDSFLLNQLLQAPLTEPTIAE